MAEQDPGCPTYKTCEGGYSSFSLGVAPSYVGFVSDSLSCVASVAMVLIYLAWKDIRKKGAQSLVTFIAIADFFTASAYFSDSVNMVVHYNKKGGRECEVFQTVCEIESYVVTWATMSSYLWTVILAFYFYLAIARNKARFAERLMPLYHVLAWGLPIAVLLPLLWFGKLTYAPFVSAIWCYLDVKAYFFTSSNPFMRRDLALAIAIKLPEVISYMLILLFYGITLRHTYRFRRETPRSNQAQAVGRVEKVLIFIPVLFIILRIWGTVQYLYVVLVLTGHSTHNGNCIPHHLKVIYVTLHGNTAGIVYWSFVLMYTSVISLSLGYWWWWTRMGKWNSLHFPVTNHSKQTASPATMLQRNCDTVTDTEFHILQSTH